MLHHTIETEKSTNGRANIVHGAISGLCRFAPGPAAMLGERLFTLYHRLCMRFGFCFDLEGINLDETELRQQLGHGRDR